MKTLSIRQPWAWLICNFQGAGAIKPKRIENRSMLKHIKGEHLIHAGKTFDQEGYEAVKDQITRSHDFSTSDKLDFFGQFLGVGYFQCGGIVGWADFSGSFYITAHKELQWYAPGQNGLIINEAGPLAFHKCLGRQSIFDVDYPRYEWWKANPTIHAETIITVCDKCLQASCWHGEFMCDESKMAGTVEKTVGDLRDLDREHPDHWKKQLKEDLI